MTIGRLFEGYGDVVEVALGPFDNEEKEFEPNVGGGVERSELKDSDFVFSKERKFPVVIPKDVGDAVSSWGRYKGSRSFEEFKSNLTRLCRRKGEKFVAALPEKWESGKEKAAEVEDEGAAMMECPDCGAEFSADAEECPECGYKRPEPKEAEKAVDTCECPKCGAEIEHEKGTPCRAVKCPKCGTMMQGKIEGEETEDKESIETIREEGQTVLSRIYGVIEALSKAVLGQKEDVAEIAQDLSLDEMLKALDKTGSAFKTFEGADGQPWIMLWTTNAFEDRDGEIFTTKSIEEYIDRHEDEDVKGVFRFWHMKGADFGDILWQGMTGRFLVEMGPYHDTKMGRAFKEFFKQYPDGHPVIAPEGWGASHGYLYRVEDRKDRVYDWFEKRESSVLPAQVASNPYNPGLEVVEMGLSPRQIEALKAIGGESLVQTVVETGEQRTKELEEAGVAFKEAKEPKGFKAQILDVAETLEDEALKATLADIAEGVEGGVGAKEEEDGQKGVGELGQALLDASENLSGEQAENLKAISGAMMKVAGADTAEKAEEAEEAEEADKAEEPESGLSAPDPTALAVKVAEALQLDALSDLIEKQTEIIQEQQEQLGELVKEIKSLKGQVDEQDKDDLERLAEKEANLPKFSWFRASQAAETVLSEGDTDQELKESKPEVPRAVAMLSQ